MARILTMNVKNLACVILLAAVFVTASQAVNDGQSDSSPHTETFLETGGVRLHYLDWGGTGEPLIFLTGYNSTPHVFDALAQRLRASFRVIGLTRRGRAPSDTPATGYELETLSDDVVKVLDALRLTRVHLVAHSFGGAEATRIAALHPRRVASVVYFDAALDPAAARLVKQEAPVPDPQPRPGTPYAQVLTWWNVYSPDFSLVRCPSLAFYALPAGPPLPSTASPAQRARATEFWRTRWLPAIRQMADKFRREAPNGRVIVLEDASHYLFEDREAEVLREMNRFYEALPR
jgi:pimeloyl-ACP methyl ester carboxylesterase